MCPRHIEISGPTWRPLRKWFPGFVILALCASVVALGLSHGLPGWLQNLGWALILLFLVGGSFYLLWLSIKDGRARFGQIRMLPKSWARWVLDEPEATKKPRSGCRIE